MSQSQTKLNSTVDDFFNTPTQKPIVKEETKIKNQNVEITKVQNVVKPIKSLVNKIEAATNEKTHSISNLEKKTIFLTEDQVNWYNENFLQFRKSNKKAKEYQFTVFLFSELAKSKLKL